MDKEEELYKVAMKRIDKLVNEVFDICCDVADENNYEKEWVIERFREKFNNRKKQDKD